MSHKVGIVNPLPKVLAYYEAALSEHVRRIGCEPIALDDVAIEGLTIPRKLQAASKAVIGRGKRLTAVDHVLVSWPAFGYFDAATWIRCARHTPTSIVVHDVDPLRRQFGYGRVARQAFATAVSNNDIAVITHTVEATHRLRELTGIDATCIAHPVRSNATRTAVPKNSPKRLLVLGQYKEARVVDPMVQLGRELSGDIELRAVGRGWPAIQGWDVRDEFVSEIDFIQELQRADAVLLPYRFYQQSGVMVRAFELGIPVVGTPHPQLAQLYGESWPGTVRDAGWGPAVERVLNEEIGSGLLRRRHDLVSEIDADLAAHILGGS